MLQAVLSDAEHTVIIRCAEVVMVPNSNVLMFYDKDGNIIGNPITLESVYHIRIKEEAESEGNTYK